MNALFKAIMLKNASSDIRNFRDTYVAEAPGFTLKFDSVLIKGVQKYLQMLKENVEVIPMEKRYYMRPEYVAYDYYGTTNLGFLILYVNDCSSATDFTMDQILVPTNEIVSFVLSKAKQFKQEIEL